MQTPRAIFFDLDETLIANKMPVPTLFQTVYSDIIGDHDDTARKAFFLALRENASTLWSTMFDAAHSPERQFVDCFAACLVATGQSRNTGQLAQAMFERFLDLSSNNVTLHHDALDTLRRLRKQGFITGIITNGMERVQRGKILQVGLESEVDHVTISAEARSHKPFAPVFELALSRAGVVPHEAWQIGDHALNDVAGAIRAGMRGVFYDPAQNRLATAFDDIPESPHHTISALADVISLISPS
ncbi:phosphoglycolate phosphatase [Arenicella chitinivorans]|uniref:Phosphoglycolate phosphatase n=1 Tax=Arenicella chitinivorans TaxID=1329800 RepID=A0A918VH35_9GAMM|nr:HAD family hydrolase [Arenicella chitinivorans]GGZ97222.1 phosphoglycolate phosphatase [Arenicella chitinivorans]